MTRRSRWLASALLAGGAALAIGGTAEGGDVAPPPLDDLVLDEMLEPMPDDADTLTDEEAEALVETWISLASNLPVADTETSSSLTGPCGGFAFSFDGDRQLIDAAMDTGDGSPPQDLDDGGQAFTSGNPFVVDTDGFVTYIGFAPRTGDGPMDHTYELSVGGVQVASGGDPNPNAKNRNAGTIFMDDELPFPITAKFSASGNLKAGGTIFCEGEGHVEINGNGLGDPAGLAGLGLTLIGVLGLLFNAPPARTWKA